MKTVAAISISISALLICGAAIFAQRSDGMDARQRELEKLRTTIRESQGRLQRLEGESRKSAAAIGEYHGRTTRLDSAIDRIQAGERRLAVEMIALQASRDSIAELLSSMREQYGRVARSLYKQRILTSNAAMLLMPEEQRMLALRQQFFERYARIQRRRAGEIATVAGVLRGEDSTLQLRQAQQMKMLAARRGEVEKLLQMEGEQRSALVTTESERRLLKEYMEKKNAEAREISSMISGLVRGGSSDQKAATPAVRQREEPKPAAKDRTASRTSRDGDRSGSPRFSWPTSARRIIEGYGERTNRQTGTVTINPGINIAAGRGSAVNAAEDGSVSLVSWLPSYGTIVIVEHRGGYRTVYGNLASASVSRGAVVRAGGRIGTVGESADGEFLHFEVWQGERRMNPAAMLP